MQPSRHLYVGADRPTTYPVLAERMGVTEREAMQAVQDARLASEPILSGARGLWLASSPQEAREWAQRQRSRAIHLMESAQGVERWADAQAGEQTTWLAA